MAPTLRSPRCGDFAGRAGGIEAVDGLEPMLADELAALAERHAERLHRFDVLEGRALEAEQVHLDAQEMLAGDEQARFRQQMIDVGDAAIERVFDRHDAIIGLARLHRRDGVLEGQARHRFALGEQRVGRRVAEGAGFALEGDELGHDESPQMPLRGAL